MILLNEQKIQAIYGMNQAITDIQRMLEHKQTGPIENPMRTVIEFPEKDSSVLYMPSTDLAEDITAMKAVTIFPNNPGQNLPTTQGLILLSNAKNGEHVAMLNASYLTRLRTGAISGLATNKLARKNAETLTMIGTGEMAFEQGLGVLAVRDIKEILLINPTKEKAHRFKEKLYDFGVDPSVTIDVLDDVSEAVARADVICCSTRSHQPVFAGKDIKSGTHVNGVGSYLPHMREVDFKFIERAEKIVVDDMEGVTEEAGELIHANQQEDWSYQQIHGELIELVTNQISSRENDEEITFFKSVGAAYYDLAVANGVYKVARDNNAGTKIDI